MSEHTLCDYTKSYDHTSELARRITPNTPDFPDLKHEGWQLVFVYGTLKKGRHNHRLLAGSYTLGVARSVNTSFKMWDTGGFPVVMKHSSHDPKAASVSGEIYYVDPITMLELDTLEANGDMYQRTKHYFFCRQQKVPSLPDLVPSIEAWMYLGVPDFWDTSIGTGGAHDISPSLVANKWILQW